MRKPKRPSLWILFARWIWYALWNSLVMYCALPWGISARRVAPSSGEIAFSGARAFEDLKRLVAFGPRPAGSPALAQSRKWIMGQLEQAGLKVESDSFLAPTPRGDIPMTNLVVKIPGASSKVVLVAGHYDTKRFDDFAFVGANDGASSAAFLLEMGRVLAHRQNRLTVWLVFFDGEEALREWTDADSLYGSRHLAAKLTSAGDLGRVQAMILVDMIGDAKLDIYRDANSTNWLSDEVFETARRLGYAKYFRDEKRAYQDDHIPFVNAGVAAVDLIDLDYGPNGAYWHTAKDTVDKCSPVSLAIVGRVVLGTLEELEKWVAQSFVSQKLCGFSSVLKPRPAEFEMHKLCATYCYARRVRVLERN